MKLICFKKGCDRACVSGVRQGLGCAKGRERACSADDLMMTADDEAIAPGKQKDRNTRD